MKETLISFSQFNEDVIMYNALKSVGVYRVFYLDIGANDAIDDSVTFLYYINGGEGIIIEPQIEYKEGYDSLRPRDKAEYIAIGKDKGEMALFGEGQSATLDESSQYAKGRKQIVTIDTLESICDKYSLSNKDIHILKIDIEGNEKDCLLGMNFRNYRPWIVCIECTEPGTMISSYDEWEYILFNNDYSFVLEYGVNRYYVPKEKKELIEILSEQKEVETNYNIVRMCRQSYMMSKRYRLACYIGKIYDKLFKKK